ncbi:MAG TPA: hypothetical protein VL200_04315 [Lacunisphaera sp.]|nr:hypothetical protein [Lacunisphaera sp.]
MLFGLAPKCLLCLAAWLPLGAWLGRKSVEICGAPGNTDWAPWPSIAGGVVGLAVSFAWRQRRFAG